MFIFEQLMTEHTITKLSLVGNTSSVTNSIAYPSGSRSGDLALYFDKCQATGVAVIPTGYTTIVSNGAVGSPNISVVSAYKVLTSSDLSANVVGSNATTDANDAKYLLVVRPDNSISGIDSRSINSQYTTGDPASQTITSSAGTAPLISIFQLASTGAVTSPTPPSGFTLITVAGNEHYILYRLTNTAIAAANSSYDQADHGSNCPQSFYIEIR